MTCTCINKKIITQTEPNYMNILSTSLTYPLHQLCRTLADKSGVPYGSRIARTLRQVSPVHGKNVHVLVAQVFCNKSHSRMSTGKIVQNCKSDLGSDVWKFIKAQVCELIGCAQVNTKVKCLVTRNTTREILTMYYII